MVRISEGYREHVGHDSESGAFNEIKQKISKEFETKFDELQGEIKDMQRDMRDVIKRMNDSAAILDSDAMPSHGNSTNTFGTSPGNVGLNESIGNLINDDMVKESNVEFTEGTKTISVRQDLEQVNVRPKVILYVGDSMFHGLDEAKMKVQTIRAIKQVKSGDTVKGICKRMRKFVQGNDKYDIESIVILAGTNDLRHKNVTPESLIFQLRSEIQKLQLIYDGRLFICKITPHIDIEFLIEK